MTKICSKTLPEQSFANLVQQFLKATYLYIHILNFAKPSLFGVFKGLNQLKKSSRILNPCKVDFFLIICVPSNEKQWLLIHEVECALIYINLGMIEQISEAIDNDKKQSVVQEPSNPKRSVKQLPFYKSSTISFVRIGACHMCKLKGKLVYQCHRGYQATSCQKKFCFDCLTLIYKDNILDALQKSDSWRCPYIRKVCRCKNCCISRKELYSILEIDPTYSVYTNLRSRVKRQGEEEVEQGEQESMRCLLKQKFKKLIDFNGQLINKVNTNYHKLTEQEIKFYNKLIHSNLTVLNNLGKSMIIHQTLLEE